MQRILRDNTPMFVSWLRETEEEFVPAQGSVQEVTADTTVTYSKSYEAKSSADA